MKPYSEYSAEELAMERLFIRWVRHPDDPQVAKFWVNWVQENPQQSETVESAKRLVDTVSDWSETEMPREVGGSLWTRILQSIESLPLLKEPGGGGDSLVRKGAFLKWGVGVGATVVFLLFVFMRETAPNPGQSESRNAQGETFGEAKHPKADSTKAGVYPDSAKNIGRLE